MMRIDTTTIYRALLLAAGLLAFAVMTLSAQTSQEPRSGDVRVVLSNHSDFETNDRVFTREDVIHIKAQAPHLDATAVAAAEFEIAPQGEGTQISGALTNHLDGTYTASVAAGSLSSGARKWIAHVRLEDENQRALEGIASFILRGKSEAAAVFRLAGQVEAVSDGSLTIAGRQIEITAQTRVRASIGGSLDLETLLHQRVIALVEEISDGRLRALVIVVSPREEGDLRLRGPITHQSEGAIRLRGTTVRIDGTTRIVRADGSAATIDDLEIGVVVALTAVRADGEWLAVEIQIRARRPFAEVPGHDTADEDPASEVRGQVEAVGQSRLTVAGVEVTVSGETEYRGVDGLFDISPGYYAEIEYVVNGAGTNVALLVDVETSDEQEDGPDDVEVSGTIAVAGDSSIEVGGFLLEITTETVIRRGRIDISAAELHEGLAVEIEAARQDNGSMVALRIDVDEDHGQTIMVRGEITGMEGDIVAIGETSFIVLPRTKISGQSGSRLQLANLAVGQHARAVLVPDSEGNYLAMVIHIERSRQPRDVRVTGRIEAATEASITVAGMTFSISEETEVKNHKGEEASLMLLQEGTIVRVKGQTRSDGSLHASDIRVQTRIHTHARIRGTVTAVEAGSFQIEGEQLRVAQQTIFRGSVRSLGDLHVGHNVMVHYVVLPDETRLALLVLATPEQEARIVFRGSIDSHAAGVLEVSGTELHTTSETSFQDRNGLEISGDQLEAGASVLVHAENTAEGLHALRVRLLETVVVHAPVEADASGSIRIAGRSVLLTDEALIVGFNNRAMAAADVTAGTVVEVIAHEQDTDQVGKSGSMLSADRVRIHSMASPTAVEDRPVGVPVSFELEQNYPNPFNPATTIAFNLQHTQPVFTRLVVFNMLGQKIATLVSGELAPGRHEIQWDARTDEGKRAASGVYVYRLEAGGHAESRSMLLLK